MMVTWWSGSVRMVNAFRNIPLEAYSCPQSALDQKFKALREQSVSAVVGLPRWFNTSLHTDLQAPNFTCKSWIFGVNIRLLTWVYSQVIWLQTCLVKEAHSHPNRVDHIWQCPPLSGIDSSNQIKVGAFGDNGKCCRHIKHGMIITLFSDKLTFLWSHTNTSKTLAIASHFINPNRWWLCISTAKCKLRCLHRGIFDHSIIGAQNDGWYGDHLQEKYLPSQM